MEIKKLGFGLMRLPYSESEEWGHADLEKTREMVDAYMKKGFTYFDTAWVYHGGHSERVFGELVGKRYPRESFQVTSKMPLWGMTDPAKLDEIFNKQLEKCCVPYFDYYFLHALNKDVFKTAENMKAFEWMQKMKAEGKIKHPGFSFHDSAEVLEEILTAHPEVELVQLQINYIDWESEGVQSRKCYEICCKHGVKVAIMEPLRGGSLAKIPESAETILKGINPDMSIASWGIRYAASLDNILVVLSGMSDMAQLEDNMSYMQDFKPLNAEEKAAVDKTVKIINDTILVPCTGCRYCVDGCPMKINIPRYFEIYNDQNRYGKDKYTWHYNETKKNGGSPADCIGCRACEGHCPQKISIVDELQNVAKTFED